jgi:C1A family cysteine protease
MKNRTGWIPDRPDHRDLLAKHLKSAPKGKGKVNAQNPTPLRVDLRSLCSPIEDQGELGSCTAHAVIGLVEYWQRKTFGKHLDLSRRFLYRTTRRLLGWKGDTGAYLRTTLKALALFGAPPEEHWPYDIAHFDEEPDAFVYSIASNFQALKYFRVDEHGLAGEALVAKIKSVLARETPLAFGITTYDNMGDDGIIRCPGPRSRADGGHAMMLVGYDDGTLCDEKSRGAFIVRNSWGTSWGRSSKLDGYGWLPYRYVQMGLADDFWGITSAEHIDVEVFK